VSSQTLLMFHVIVDIFLKMEFSLNHLLTPTKQFSFMLPTSSSL
jgi:hypothetical protein